MLTFMNKADVAQRIHACIEEFSSEPGRGVDGTKAILLYSGILVETAFLFDNCEEALEGSFDNLARLLNREPLEAELPQNFLPPATIIDFDTEQGRALAREFFEEWLDCAYEFHDMMLFLVHQTFMRWEAQGQPREVSFRMLVECTYRAMGYELAAQELCDVVIEKKIGIEGWTLGDCVSGLAGMAGRKLAYSHDGQKQCCWFNGSNLPDLLDQTAYVMTQEAVRLGLPAGSDWRLGLAANDTPPNPPVLLVNGLEPYCRSFFETLGFHNVAEQAVACAKAAGRMIAVAAGGGHPGLEPPIAKPLAMAALTESYKSVCMEYAVVS